MGAEVEHTLATFLEAFPYQVKTWDAKAIANLSEHPQAFEEFKAGNEATKWQIYLAMRRPSMAHTAF